MTKHVKFDNFYLLILIVGYVVISFLPGFYGGESRIFTIPYRAAVLFLAVYIIITRSTKNKFGISASQLYVFVIFWMIYLLRMFLDLYIFDIKADIFSSKADYLLNAIGICFLPAYSIRFLNGIDFDWVLKWFYRILFVALALSLLMNLSVDSTEESGAATNRMRGSAGLNTIIYGHLGVTFCLLSLYLLKTKRRLLVKILYVFLAILGIYIMVIAGSRSPVVALFIGAIFLYIKNKKRVRVLIFLFILASPIILFTKEIIDMLPVIDNPLYTRVMLSVKSGNTSGRTEIYAQAWEEFTESPIFGNAFLVQGKGYANYPHNLILESLMATGVIGAGFFIGWIIKCLKRGYRILIGVSNFGKWVPVLFVQYFILGLFSVSIFTNSYFWYYSVIIYSLYNRLRNQQNFKLIKTDKI